MHIILIQSGDIEPNPGPMPNLLQKHPNTHKNRHKTYFLPSTIKLQPEYQHLATQFSPSINITHPKHHDATNKYPHLSQYIYQNQHHPPPRMLYALIITPCPTQETCNQLLTHTPSPDWTTTLLTQITLLQNPPERHIRTIHPYTLFKQENQNLINPPKSIHKEIYNYIEENKHNINLNTLTNKFPYLPENLLRETLKYNEPINEYSHPPQLPNNPPHTTHNTQMTNQNIHIITWNATSLNTTLPNLHQLIIHNPTIITIQETKLTATKSTKYIQNLFPKYKLIFNNTHTLTRCMLQRRQYTTTRGGLLTLINKDYAYPRNISKIPPQQTFHHTYKLLQ